MHFGPMHNYSRGKIQLITASKTNMAWCVVVASRRQNSLIRTNQRVEMLRTKHQEDSADGKEGD